MKSNMLLGSFKSMWRAMTGPVFDFQGDPAQQGGALILGPGELLCFVLKLWSFSVAVCFNCHHLGCCPCGSQGGSLVLNSVILPAEGTCRSVIV